MRNRIFIAISVGFLILPLTTQPSNAVLSAAIFVDNYVKKQAKKALATPGHSRWCAKNHKGYRKLWNTYPTGGGRISHCASPYYSPPWKKWHSGKK